MYKVTLLTLILAKVLQSEYWNIYMNMISEEECTFVQSQWCGWYSHWVTLEIINIVSSLARAAVSESLWSGDSEQGWSSNWSTQLLIVSATAAAPLTPLSTIVMGKLFVLLHPDQAGSVSVIKDSVIVMIQETLASWLWSVIPLLKVIILYHFILMDQDITHHHTYNSRSLTTHVSC